MMKHPHSLEITLPVLNEEQTLAQQVDVIVNHIEQNIPEDFSVKVVIADNGSTDKTPEIAQELVQKYTDRVKHIRLDKKGVGLALKTSWLQSEADIVGYFDLDLATDLAHLKETLDCLFQDDADLVYGTRLHQKSVVVGRTLKRGFVSRAFNLILKLYLNVSFSDGMCGFKFLKRARLKELMEAGAESDGWFFSTELLVTAEWLRMKVVELPVKWTDDPDSRVKIIPLTLQYLKAMKSLKAKKPAYA